MKNIIQLLIIIGTLIGVISFVFGVLSFVAGERLLLYLKKHKSERWAEITGVHTVIGGIFCGGGRFYYGWRYVNSDKDSDDLTINKLKLSMKKATNNFCRFFICSLCIYLLTVLAILLLKSA
jgi:uncharacterized membrane protein